jgi:hypothetical protein
MATAAQIAANRRNAALSTGPKSQRGKLASSQNARQHGLYSATSILPADEFERFEAAHLHFLDLYSHPSDPEAQRLILEIALAYHRRELAREMSFARLTLYQQEFYPGPDSPHQDKMPIGERHNIAYQDDALNFRLFERYFKLESASSRQFDKATRELLARLALLAHAEAPSQDETNPIPAPAPQAQPAAAAHSRPSPAKQKAKPQPRKPAKPTPHPSHRRPKAA